MEKKSSKLYFAIYKPYGILSQFRDEGNKKGLGSIYNHFPKDVYPVGRLDADSEGLLLLSNDNHFKHRLLEPTFAHTRTYWVQVEGSPKEDDLQPLRDGLLIRAKKKEYFTRPAQAQLLKEPELPPRNPPIRYRAEIPTTWLRLTLTEGKNRQVRKMTAKIGFPTLRLLRVAIGNYHWQGQAPGDYWEIPARVAYQQILGRKA